MKTPWITAGLLAALACGTVLAQTPPPACPPVQNVLQLSATGTVDAPQDLLTMQLSTTREGPEAAAVQGQLKTVLEAALAEARKAVQPGQLEARTGNFSLFPRHGRDGKITGWQGTAELILEGRDFPRITQLAGRIPGMTVSGIGFGLSREQRRNVESQAQAIAIERFKARAAELAKGFGFSGYGLREVSVQSSEPDFPPRPRPYAMEARTAMADAPVPVEPGKSAVTVVVSGSVQLR